MSEITPNPTVPAFVVRRLTIYALELPLRRTVSHAGARRSVSDPVVVAVELSNGVVGYGETLPRSYVTGESVESVVETIRSVFVPVVLGFRVSTWPEALEVIGQLPDADAVGHRIPAARAAVELALLDATMRAFGIDVDDITQWMGLPGFGSPGSLKRIRFSGVLASERVESTRRLLRMMYWGGLRQFKVKVGTPGDVDRLRAVCAYLERPIRRGLACVRLDANGAWNAEQAQRWLSDVADLPILAIEQPLPRDEDDQLVSLRERIRLAVFHDESLCTIQDAERLIALGVADGFNIRLSKCGGLMPSLAIAALARRSNVRIQIGCMVGETSILAAVGLRLLQVCPGVEWAEGCFGSFLLSDDVVGRGIRFGYGGRPPRVTGAGWGIDVDPVALERLCVDRPEVVNL